MTRTAIAASVAGIVLAGSVASAFGQSALPRRNSPRDDGSGYGIGGTISGRVNLLGPAGAGGIPTPSIGFTGPADGLPPPPPPPATTDSPSSSMFAPQRLDKYAPPMIEGLKLPRQNPGQLMKPAALPPANAAPGSSASPASPSITAPLVKQAVRLTASFDEGRAKILSGVKWRVFTDQPDANGEHLLVAESTDASPKFELDPGNYIVHAVYGLVSTAKYMTVKAAQPTQQNIVIKAGGVRLSALVGEGKAPADEVFFKLAHDEGGVVRTVAEHVKPGSLLRLPAGAYHVVSNYGDANATVEVDLQIGAGKLVDAQVHHRAAAVELKLVNSPGGPELNDTSWTILTPGGDVIRDSIGALPKIVLAEGDYVAIARHDGKSYQQPFAVRAGADESVTVSAASN